MSIPGLTIVLKVLDVSTVALLFGKTTGSKLSLTIRETEKLHHSPTMNFLSVMLKRTKLRGILVIRTSPSRSCLYQCIIFSYSVFDVKRLIGRKFDDPMVQSDLKYFPFKVFDNPTSMLNIVVSGKNLCIFLSSFTSCMKPT